MVSLVAVTAECASSSTWVKAPPWPAAPALPQDWQGDCSAPPPLRCLNCSFQHALQVGLKLACPCITHAVLRCAALCMQSVENEANVVSAYYGVPILSMRSALFHLIAEGREGYQVWGVGLRLVL